MSIISASTTSTTAYKVTADTTGTLVFQTGATPTTAMTLGSDQSVTFAGAQTYTGAATFTTGITVQGLTVGRGAGAISTNTAVGASALAANTTGANNTAVGYQSLYSNVTGGQNTAFGQSALYSNTASENTAFGRQAGYSNTSGTGNLFMGLNTAYSNTTGSSNTALGYSALTSNTTASYNTAVGYQAGYTSNRTADAFGYNVFVGSGAGYSATTGQNNTFVGGFAGNAVTSGSKNTILGRYDGNQGGLDIRTADNNVVLSDGDGNPRLRIPSNGDTQLFATASNFSLRNSNTAGTTNAFLTGLYSATDITSGGTVSLRLWTNGNIQNTNNSYGALSDIKLKENIVDVSPKLADLMRVRVVNYNFKEGQTHKQIGVIAQELEQVFPSMVEETQDFDSEGNGLQTTTKAVKYSVFVPMLVKAIQELKAEFDAYKEANK